MASITVTLLDGTGSPQTFRAWQDTVSGSTVASVALQSCIEVEGSTVDTGNPLPVSISGGIAPVATALINSAAVPCSATAGTAISVVPYSATRKLLIIYNRSTGIETVDIGPSNVAEGGGIPLAPGGGGYQFVGPGAAGPIYAISPVASTPLSFVEG
jgi:hypothetical protein